MKSQGADFTARAEDQEQIPDHWVEELCAYSSESARPGSHVDEAIQAMARKRFAQIRAAKHDTRIVQFKWALGAAAACAIFALAWHVKPDRDQSVSGHSGLPNYSLILKEVSQLFPGQLRSISTDGKSLSIELADEPIHQERQAIVIQLQDHQVITGVITYVGQTIELDQRQFTVQIDSNGDIVIEGDGCKGVIGEPIQLAPNKIITIEKI